MTEWRDLARALEKILEQQKMIVSVEDKLQCVIRELKMRKNVYPRWIEQGRLTSSKAKHEIECMEAIVEDYQTLAAKERLL